MNLNRYAALLAVQLLSLAALAAALARGEGSTAAVWAFLTAAAAAGAMLLASVRRSRTRLQRMTAELQRAAGGNYRTRLLAGEDRTWNEALFAVNGLIERLERLEAASRSSEAARRRLLSSISHDIRTPLTSIVGYVDAIREGIVDTERERSEYLAVVSAKAAALQTLIDEIFTMSKLDADELPMRPEPLDLAEAAREAVIAVLPEIGKLGLELRTELPDQPCPVLADRLALERIAGNLLRNALQHGKEGLTIGVGLAETERTYELVVWDRGPGIAPDELPQVFERSYRGDKSRGTEGGGSGLGLAIARSLAGKNGGSLEAASIPWERTEFRLALPKSPPPGS